MNSHEKLNRLINWNNTPELTLRSRAMTLALPDIQTQAREWRLKELQPLIGLILLWHDHWSESHAIAQSQEGVRDFDLLHAIGHRREGDYSNSVYWFEQAGDHPMFESLIATLQTKIGGEGDKIGKLVPSGKWSPKKFVQAVKSSPQDPALRVIQSLEIKCFMDYLVRVAT